MGLAIIINGADFSANNLGKITLQQDLTLDSLSVSNTTTSYTGKTFQCGVTFTPAATSERDVTWSITNGSQYATIDNSGKVTIKAGTIEQTITVKVTSTKHSDIFATKDFTITYSELVDELTAITISCDAVISASTFTPTVSFTPSNTTHSTVTWSITSGSDYASIDSITGKVTIKSAANNSNITIKATSTTKPSVSGTKTVKVTYVDSSVLYALNEEVSILSLDDVIDTGVKLFDTDKDFTAIVKFSGWSTGNSPYLNGVYNPGGAARYISLGTGATNVVNVGAYSGAVITVSMWVGNTQVSNTTNTACVMTDNPRLMIVKEGSSISLHYYDKNGYKKISSGTISATSDGTLKIGGHTDAGGSYWSNVKVAKAKILNYAVAESDASTYMSNF